jgi:hypothetical protein
MNETDYRPGPQYSIIPAVATRDTRLSPRDLHVLAIIGTYTNERGICWPSQSSIGELAGVSRRMVQKCVATLTQAGYLKLTRRVDAAGGDASCLIEVLHPRPDPQYLRQTTKQFHAFFSQQPSTPATSEVAPPATSEVAPPATSEVAPPATSEVALTTPSNDPTERYSPPTPPRQQTPPPELDAEIWEQWEQHRRALRKPLTPQARALQWKKLAEWGWEHQRAIIERSIERGWQGLFPPDHEQNVKRESVLERVQRQTLAKHSHRAAVEAQLTKLLGAGDGR